MSKFPLYDRLLTDIPQGPLSRIRKRTFISNLGKMDQSGHESVYALMRMHQSTNDTSETLPWKGELIRGDIKFDLDEIPHNLQQILYKFSKTHLELMETDTRHT